MKGEGGEGIMLPLPPLNSCLLCSLSLSASLNPRFLSVSLGFTLQPEPEAGRPREGQGPGPQGPPRPLAQVRPLERV